MKKKLVSIILNDGLRPHKHDQFSTHDLVDTYDDFCDFSNPNLYHRRFDPLCADRVGDEYAPQTTHDPMADTTMGNQPDTSIGKDPDEDMGNGDTHEDTMVDFPGIPTQDQAPNIGDVLDRDTGVNYVYVEQSNIDTGQTETVVIHKSKVDKTTQTVVAAAADPPDIEITHIVIRTKPYMILIYIRNGTGMFISQGRITILDRNFRLQYRDRSPNTSIYKAKRVCK